MQHVVLTGASRGLGAEFVNVFLERGDRVAALARDPQRSDALQSLAADHGDRLTMVPCDVTDDAAVVRAVELVTGPVDLLINNAGVSGSTGGTLMDLDWDEFRRVNEVNLLGPLRTTRAFLPALKQGTPGKVVQITSRMGSIADNDSGGWWSYRCSKAALNMANTNLAKELAPAEIPCIVLHPGWVKTDMGGDQAPLSPAESVAGMVKVIDGLSMARTGTFTDYSGSPIPW